MSFHFENSSQEIKQEIKQEIELELLESEQDMGQPLITPDPEEFPTKPRRITKTQSETYRDRYGNNFLGKVNLNRRFDLLYKFIKDKFKKYPN